MKRRVLICGGRDFSDLDLFNKIMQQVQPWLAKDFCIINGFARGADKIAHNWAFNNGIPSLCVPANWDYYGTRAGSIRNEWMLTYCDPDLVIAFPGENGTKNMIRLAKGRRLDIYEVKNGSF